MTNAGMLQFLWGALAMGSVVVGLLFLRFWRLSHERLLFFFALGFFAFALNWLGLGIVNTSADERHWFYLLRLLAFALIITGIVDKNRSRSRPARESGRQLGR